MPVTGSREYFAKNDFGKIVEANKVKIESTSATNNSEDSDIPVSNNGFNKIVVSLEDYNSPVGTYCDKRSYKLPRFDLYRCKEISTISYGNNQGIMVHLQLSNSPNKCGLVDSFGVKESIKEATCNRAQDLSKFRVFYSRWVMILLEFASPLETYFKTYSRLKQQWQVCTATTPGRNP